jgi:hypothetical protein
LPNADDVNTVIVNVQLTLDDRKSLRTSPDNVLAEAEAEASRVLADSGHADLRQESVETWGKSRTQSKTYARQEPNSEQTAPICG